MDTVVDVVVWLGVATAGLIALLAVGYVIWPLLQPGPTLPLVEDSRLTELLVRKDILLRGIKDLEFDRQMGKISDADYARFSARLRRQAIGVMQQIDKVAPDGVAHDGELEAEIARLRKVQPTAHDAHSAPGESAAQAQPLESDPLPGSATVSALPTASNGDADRPRFCTQCGTRVAAGHKFCAECGTPVGKPAL
ncbi:MAG: zinc-ribbon domain-containing protein [Litorilinea sp.]